MTLKEALESNKNYKRKHESIYRQRSNDSYLTFSTVELLADDWEVQRDEIRFLIDYRDTSHFAVQNYERLKGRLWSVVATEVSDED